MTSRKAARVLSGPGPSRAPRSWSVVVTTHRAQGFATSKTDALFADADGFVFAPLERVGEILQAAFAIQHTERQQAESLKAGVSLGSQLRFGEFLEARSKDPSLTFREHPRRTGGAVEV